MPKILVSDSLSKEGLDALENAKSSGIQYAYKPGLKEDELAAAIPEYDGLVIRSGSKVTARVLEAAANLKVVGRAGIGVDNVNVAVATRRGVIVMNTPTGNTITTAEHAIALLFAVARKLGMADATMKQGQWEKKKLEGRELTGKTLGVIGLGNIGRIVADRGRGLHMHVIAFDPVLTTERAQELGVELVSLDELFARADAITLHTPRTPQTLNLINDQTIAKMKKGVLLINAARGGICDEAAVVRGLESGQIGGAGFDVFSQEPPGLTDLVKHPNAVATPHLGASTEEAQTRVAVEICEQVIAYLVNGTITNSVNVPAVPREQAAALTPYVTLGRRLGQFLGANESLVPRSISVEFGGEAANVLTKPIVNAAVAGVLGRFLEDEVNEISAPLVAKDRGIEIERANVHREDVVRNVGANRRHWAGRSASPCCWHAWQRSSPTHRVLGRFRYGRTTGRRAAGAAERGSPGCHRNRRYYPGRVQDQRCSHAGGARQQGPQGGAALESRLGH